MHAHDGCVWVQMVDLEEVVLPGNARLLYHDNECYDWGTLGWIMSAGMVDVEDYKYFIMINSSVRGPYAPPYLPVGSFCTHVIPEPLDRTGACKQRKMLRLTLLPSTCKHLSCHLTLVSLQTHGMGPGCKCRLAGQ